MASGSFDSKRLRPWIAVLLWAAVVWALGGDGFSHTETSRILVPLIRWLAPELSGRELLKILFWIRKSAHAIEYALLTVLLLRALLLAARADWRSAAVSTLLAVLVFAAADEGRQGLSRLRSGSSHDVMLDLAGAALALAVLALLQRRLRRPLWRPADPAPS